MLFKSFFFVGLSSEVTDLTNGESSEESLLEPDLVEVDLFMSFIV
jgi:hypothetical protein